MPDHTIRIKRGLYYDARHDFLVELYNYNKEVIARHEKDRKVLNTVVLLIIQHALYHGHFIYLGEV